MRVSALLFGICVALGAHRACAQPFDCNRPAPDAIAKVQLPGHPFSAIPTADGCTIFVSLTPTTPGEKARVAVLSRRAGRVSLVRTVVGADQLIGMALSPDGRVLAAADSLGVTLFDAARLVRGAGEIVLAKAADEPNSGAAYVAFSPDGRLLVVSDEQARAVTVYDFAAFRRGQPLTAIGKIPVDHGPSGLAFSPDSRRLYVTVQVGGIRGTECRAESPKDHPHASGQLVVVDAYRAAVDPVAAVVATVEAGCNPVRVAVSPRGDRAYVTMRGSNAVGVFDTGQLVGDGSRAATGLFKVGESPVGITATDKLVFATNSDRFSDGRLASISVVDLASPTHATTIPFAGFPRELKLTADLKTLLVTNYSRQELELVNLARLSEVEAAF
jgi:DNA-binding beta-propeller fold protein YncE